MLELSGRTQQQLTDKVIMVRPSNFGFNSETALTNSFQKTPEQYGLKTSLVQTQALKEFNQMALDLQNSGIDVMILPDRQDLITPDAIFPNNWFSLHSPDTLVLYPMLTPNRRNERQLDKLLDLLSSRDVSPTNIVNFAGFERNGLYLEGTGSMVLDRANRVAYAMESQRTSQDLFERYCKQLDFQSIFFHSFDSNKFPIYHTNVVMSIGQDFGVICPESIQERQERDTISEAFERAGNELITISSEQLSAFCGNILELKSQTGEPKIVLSETAYQAFGATGCRQLERYGTLLPVKIPTIEGIGGGSARCMIAEVFA